MLPACSSFADYTRWRTARLCAAMPHGTVYDRSGKHEAPCWQAAGEKQTSYAGDSGWPFEPGVCADDGTDARNGAPG